MWILTIICRKYNRNSELVIKQETEFDEYEYQMAIKVAMIYFDCDLVQLEINYPDGDNIKYHG